MMESRASSRRWGRGLCIQWQSLPPEVMCRVFSYLGDVNRCQARLTCHAWDKVFRTPQLWRERNFAFRGTDKDEGWRAARFMETLGTHIKHLELEIGMPVVQNARIISMSVEKLLMTKARGMRLQSFTCSGLEFFQTPLYRIARHRLRMVRALCSMLRRQKGLLEVNLACSQMGREDGVRVMKALTFHCRLQPGRAVTSSLSSVELRDFFIDDVNVVECHAFLDEVGKFHALRHIGLNFVYLSDRVLDTLTTTAKNLEALSLSMDGSHLLLVAHLTYNNLMVSTAGWCRALCTCPQLRVYVDIRGRFRLIDFQRVLLPGMPLASLNITSLIASMFFGSDDMLAHIAHLLGYLGDHYWRTLNSFYLRWCDTATVWTDGEALVRLVRCCPSLRRLSLTMNVPLDTVLQIATASKHWTEPLHVYVGGLDVCLGSPAVQAKLSSTKSQCVVHSGSSRLARL